MIDQSRHEMLAKPLPDEEARQRFVLSLKRHIGGPMREATPVVWAREAEPAFSARVRRAPATREEAEAALDATRFHRFAKRSEEHTSELQSLMRISYAVFCLKKKNKKKNKRNPCHNKNKQTL